MEKLDGWKRTHTCGEVTLTHKDQTVILMGWVHRWRDHGGLIFIDLRDRYGLTQIVFAPDAPREMYEHAKELRAEFVVAVKGVVQKRPEGMSNPNLKTGEIEIGVQELKILNPALTPPFGIDENQDVSEELRLKYRYLDLRGSRMRNNLLIRHQTYQAVRNYLNGLDFVEIETPILMRSTPEGARDYLVPSRVHPGKFYALPQSPQTYKQILMVAGFDRYYQIVRCFRDEDLRADRQPEFTQIDVEMSFVEQEDVLQMVEGLMKNVIKEVLDLEIDIPFSRLSHNEAMTRYGTDKPDTRFGLEITDISAIVKDCNFRVFSENVTKGGIVCGLCLPGGARYSRKQIDELTKYVTESGAKGLVAIKVAEDGWESNLSKFFSDEQVKSINQSFSAKCGDMLFLISDERESALNLAGVLRLKLANQEGLIPADKFNLVWILDFPLVEYDALEKRFAALHHPFTSPTDEDVAKMESDPGSVRAKAYDLVMNGYEIAGGSIRIHRRELQDKMFRLLNIGEAEARDKFGFLLEAFEYGAPPHGGIAFGFDRLIMLFTREKTIRDVIAFPKTASAISLMDRAPSAVEDKQLKELGLKII